MADNNNDNSREKAFETLKSALIAILFLIAGWTYNSMNKLEERLFAMSSNSMTQANAQQLEARINQTIQNRFDDVNNRLDLILRLVQQAEKK